MLWILHKTYAPKGGPKAPIYVCPQSRRLPARKRSTCCGGLVLLRGGWRLVVLRTTLRYLFGCGFAAPPPSKNLPNGKPGTQRVTSRASDLAGR